MITNTDFAKTELIEGNFSRNGYCSYLRYVYIQSVVKKRRFFVFAVFSVYHEACFRWMTA